MQFLAGILLATQFIPTYPYLGPTNVERIIDRPELVESGLSLNSSTVAKVKLAGRGTGGAGVRCILSISNWSMYTLLDVESNTECGTTDPKFPPRNVFPGDREVMVLQNTHPMIGTCGTLSWQLVEVNLRLIIMWSVPFNFNLRDSYYAIGLTHNKGKFPNSAYWFHQMYYGTNNAFRRSRTGRSLTFSSPLISVHGFMEANTYHSVLNISVVPRRSYHLAESIQRRLLFSSLPPERTISSSPTLFPSPILTSLPFFLLRLMPIEDLLLPLCLRRLFLRLIEKPFIPSFCQPLISTLQ